MDEFLEIEDLTLWRNALARKDALEINPEAFNQQESIDVMRNFFEVTGTLFNRYQLEEEHYSISPHSGRIIESEK